MSVETAYRYDWDGELIESFDQARGRTEYRYDPVGQLLAMVPEKARGELFRYDARGNIFEDEPGAPGRVYGPGNRLLRRGSTEYTWDADGRLSEKRERDGATGKDELWRYEWNAAGLLERVTTPDGLEVAFEYDPFARRLSKRVTKSGPGAPAAALVSETRFVWDGDVLVHELRTAASEAGDPIVEERTYCFEDGGFEPRAHREAKRAGADASDTARSTGRWYHYVNDPIGTPERLVDVAGNVACDLERKAWGELQARPGAKANTPIRLQGQYWDEETGLAYNRWRYFDNCAGRFASPDPSELKGGLNVFANAPSPLRWTDPLGLAKRSRQSGKEGATDIPSWVKGTPGATKGPEESGKDVAARVCDAKYGRGKYDTGPGSEYNKIKKYFDRHER